MRRVSPDVPPPSQNVAKALQEQPAALDDLVRARMEKNLVDAWRARGARSVALRGPEPPRPHRP